MEDKTKFNIFQYNCVLNGYIKPNKSMSFGDVSTLKTTHHTITYEFHYLLTMM